MSKTSSFNEGLQPKSVGGLIQAALTEKKLTVEIFCKKCGIDPALAKKVLSGEIEPDDEFLERSSEVFPMAWRAFRKVRNDLHELNHV